MLYVHILYKTSLADSTSDFIKYVERSMISNFPVTKSRHNMHRRHFWF